MPQPDRSVPGAPCWIDVMTSDPDKTVDFYGQLFGWTATRGGEEFGGYISLSKDGARVAGAMQSQPGSGPPNIWSVYLATDDAAATARAATEHGGKVQVEPMPVGDLGSMAYVEDAGGAAIGAWQAGSHQGFDVIAEPGAPAWFELLTRDYAGSVQWYRDVFGWDTETASDTEDFRYTTLGSGDSQRAGIMDAAGFLPDGVPAHWSVYFHVDDADAALLRIQELGGSVIQSAETTPYGRLASASDALGAQFKIVDPSRRS